MNEEIFKRLQDQCWIYNTHPDMIDTDSNGESRPCGFDTKKLAELIVRECMMLVEGFESTQEVALDEYVDYEASAVLKEHFGIDE